MSESDRVTFWSTIAKAKYWKNYLYASIKNFIMKWCKKLLCTTVNLFVTRISIRRYVPETIYTKG